MVLRSFKLVKLVKRRKVKIELWHFHPKGSRPCGGPLLGIGKTTSKTLISSWRPICEILRKGQFFLWRHGERRAKAKWLGFPPTLFLGRVREMGVMMAFPATPKSFLVGGWATPLKKFDLVNWDD